VVRANQQTFASFGLVQNDPVLEICKMDHVTPDYILGRKRQREAERRYSHGLLLTVVRCKDKLPPKYLTHEEEDSQTDVCERETEFNERDMPKSAHDGFLRDAVLLFRAW
jgi:hypothetical protein